MVFSKKKTQPLYSILKLYQMISILRIISHYSQELTISLTHFQLPRLVLVESRNSNPQLALR